MTFFARNFGTKEVQQIPDKTLPISSDSFPDRNVSLIKIFLSERHVFFIKIATGSFKYHDSHRQCRFIPDH